VPLGPGLEQFVVSGLLHVLEGLNDLLDVSTLGHEAHVDDRLLEFRRGHVGLSLTVHREFHESCELKHHSRQLS